jgi:alkylated DNA repair dioxygenase AlkB
VNAIANTVGAQWRHFDLPDADMRVMQFCDALEARDWFDRLRAEIPWEQHRIRLFGRNIDAPRLSCWVGDAGTAYTYSRVRYEPHAWSPALSQLRDAVSELCAQRYNSVLCNRYRDGNDSMGWHSDDEFELGADPIIASLSFGATRRFRLRRKDDSQRRFDIDLQSGDLLLMAGATQRNYRHDLPKDKHAGERINLTFRRILQTQDFACR